MDLLLLHQIANSLLLVETQSGSNNIKPQSAPVLWKIMGIRLTVKREICVYVPPQQHRLCLDISNQVPLTLPNRWNATNPCQLELSKERLLDNANLQTSTKDNDDGLLFQTIWYSTVMFKEKNVLQRNWKQSEKILNFYFKPSLVHFRVVENDGVASATSVLCLVRMIMIIDNYWIYIVPFH